MGNMAAKAKKSLKIGFFTDTYLPTRNGIGVSIETYREQLELLGHEVYVIAPSPGFRYKETSKRIIRFPAIKGLFFDDYLTSVFFPPQALHRIDKIKLDVVHYHTPGQVGLLGAYYAIRNKLPLVTTYHTDLYKYVIHYKSVLPGTIALSLMAPMITGGGLVDYRNSLSSIKPERNIDKWNQKIVERGITMIHNACDQVIAPSRKMQLQLESWHAHSPITILPSGVDKITTSTQEIKAWRRKLDLPEGTPVIIFVGRLGTEKNLSLLVKAFEIIARKLPEVRLLVVGGSGSLTVTAGEAFMAEAHAITNGERIIFTGFVPHEKLGALYGLSTVFAFPSLTETQGLVLHEAAMAGLPIVMIDHGITEVVINHENGYYARNTARNFAGKLLQVLQASPERRAKMGARSIELASRLSASKQAIKLLRLYQEVIERHYAESPPRRRRLPWSR